MKYNINVILNLYSILSENNNFFFRKINVFNLYRFLKTIINYTFYVIFTYSIIFIYVITHIYFMLAHIIIQ